MTIENIPYDEYDQRDAVRASVLFQRSWKQVKWVLDGNPTVTEDAVRVGHAAHSIVEYLPQDRFAEFFVVQPDFKNSPDNVTSGGQRSYSKTNWVREQEEAFAANETREVLTSSEYRRLVRVVKALDECPDAMQLIASTQQESKEVSFFGEVFGVQCKARVDGLWGSGSLWWNLKTTNNLGRFQYQVRDLKYLQKDAFHLLVMRANGVEPDELRYIVVEDARPSEGIFRAAPEACVFSVPAVALENYFPEINILLGDYAACWANNKWPGMESQPLEIVSMPEVTLVD